MDVVALSILSGAHMTLFPLIHDQLVAKGATHMLLTGGGIIPPQDIETLSKKGIGKLFGPGSPTKDAIEYIKEWCAAHPRTA